MSEEKPESRVVADSTAAMSNSEKGSDNLKHLEDGNHEGQPATVSNHHIDSEDDFKFTFGMFLACLSLLTGYMAAVFCIQMVSAILTTINADIGPSTSFSWLATAQIVPVGVFGPLVGRLSDIYGRRKFLIIGNILGLIGCVMSATAQHINVAIGGGILIGTASACQQVAWAGLTEVVPRKYRSLALGIFEAGCIPPGAFGPIMGNAISKYSSWRWAYWVPFILNCLGLVMVFLFYRPKNQYIKEEGKTRLQEVKDLDWIGFALWTIALCLFLLGISFGGDLLTWKSGGTISMIVLGVVFVVILGLYEAYYPQVFPLFPPAIFRKIRGVTVVLVGTFLYGMLYYSTAILWPQQVQALYTTDLLKIGWYASALGIAGIASSPLFGWLLTKINSRILFIFIIVNGTIASGCMAIVSPSSSTGSTVLVALEGITVGGGMIIATAMVQLAVKHEYLGIATALAVTVRNVGGAVGQVIYVSILTGQLKENMVKYVAKPLAFAGVPVTSLPAVLGALTGTGPESALAVLTPPQIEVAIDGVHKAFSHAFRVVYLTSIAFGVLGTITVCFCKDIRPLLTHHVDIDLDEGVKFTGGETDTGGGHIIRIESQEKLHHKHARGETHHDDASPSGDELR